MHPSCVEGDRFYGWVAIFMCNRGVGFIFLMCWGVWCMDGIPVGCYLVCAIACIVLVWFVYIWLCPWGGSGGALR